MNLLLQDTRDRRGGRRKFLSHGNAKSTTTKMESMPNSD